MTDTVRTLSALQALLADNTSGGISPQDLRDAVISALGYEYCAAVAVNTTLDADHRVIAATGGASGITLTLPAVADAQHKVYKIMKVDGGAGAITIDGHGSETINGATTITLSAQYDGVTLHCPGTAWLAFWAA